MKKALALALSVIICATALLTGTIAFFTDEERADNEFEVGNVNIEQYERDHDGNDFKQNQSLNPIVTPLTPDPTKEYVDYDKDPTGSVQLRNTGYFSNYLDKIVTVENIGKNPAYVRNIVAIPTGLPAGAKNVDWLEFDFLDANSDTNADWTALANPVEEDVEIDGVLYDLYVFNYTGTDGKLQPEDTTLPTLLGFGMSSNVNFEEKLTKTGDNTYTDEHGNTASFAIEYDTGKYGAFYYCDPANNERTYLTITSLDQNHIYVATQAVQVEGFENLDHAFKNGFNGDITEKNHPWYKAPVEPIMGKVGETEYTWKQLVDEQLVTTQEFNGQTFLNKIHNSVTELIITSDNVDLINTISMTKDEVAGSTLRKVIIGDNVEIYGNAFQNFKALEEVVISGKAILTAYGYQFYGCNALTTLTLSSGITSIPQYCFYDCDKLGSIYIPSSVTSVSTRAFGSCSMLSEVKLPSTLTIDESDVFYGTPAYTNTSSGIIPY